MKTFPDLVVCEHCDTVYHRETLSAGQVAYCERCAAVLYRAGRLDVDRWLALTLAAAVAFIIANVTPLVSVGLQGSSNDATLWEAAMALVQGPIALIAAPTLMAIILVPGAQIVLLAWVLLNARGARRAPGFALAMRALVVLRPWGMIEVCLLGILVALIKLSSTVQVTLQPGLWAMAALMVLITIIANRDTQWLWPLTEPEALKIYEDDEAEEETAPSGSPTTPKAGSV
ncbi:paraquat-inducible protein A [Marinimicrobium sp. ARAG 43.8]|uniref:paraquat-inducible protein A n=1 Tax=Marinimicrobium sp. ARAG 43.8 TaxID=3418719 RepID=UPI003CE70CD0